MFASHNIYTQKFSKKSLVLLQQTVATLGEKKKKKAVVSFPFPYNYGTVIVQQAVHVTKGTDPRPNESESVEKS